MLHQNVSISSTPSPFDIVSAHHKVILSYQCAKPYAQYMATNILPRLEDTVMVVLGELAPSTMWSLFEWMKRGQYIGDRSYDRYVRHSRHVRQRDLAQWIDRADIVCLANNQPQSERAPLSRAMMEASETPMVYSDDMGETIHDQIETWAKILNVRYMTEERPTVSAQLVRPSLIVGA